MTHRLEGIEAVAFDADDTLWHSENLFHAAHQQYHELLAAHTDLSFEELEARMLTTERRNLQLFGYGAKGFTLSLIETAIELTDGRIPARDIERLIGIGKDLLRHPVELLPGVEQTIDRLDGAGFRLLLVTKGDLWHQESKIAASGLADRFEAVEIVSEKSEQVYAAVLGQHGIEPARFCMVGNSVRSDVLPVLRIGGRAVHVPYEYLWAHEAADAPVESYVAVERIDEVPPLLGC